MWVAKLKQSKMNQQKKIIKNKRIQTPRHPLLLLEGVVANMSFVSFPRATTISVFGGPAISQHQLSKTIDQEKLNFKSNKNSKKVRNNSNNNTSKRRQTHPQQQELREQHHSEMLMTDNNNNNKDLIISQFQPSRFFLNQSTDSLKKPSAGYLVVNSSISNFETQKTFQQKEQTQIVSSTTIVNNNESTTTKNKEEKEVKKINENNNHQQQQIQQQLQMKEMKNTRTRITIGQRVYSSLVFGWKRTSSSSSTTPSPTNFGSNSPTSGGNERKLRRRYFVTYRRKHPLQTRTVLALSTSNLLVTSDWDVDEKQFDFENEIKIENFKNTNEKFETNTKSLDNSIPKTNSTNTNTTKNIERMSLSRSDFVISNLSCDCLICCNSSNLSLSSSTSNISCASQSSMSGQNYQQQQKQQSNLSASRIFMLSSIS